MASQLFLLLLRESNIMKSLAILAAAASLLLSGCATTIRSDVTTFQAWPASLPEKSYVFDQPRSPDDTLELRTYQAMVGQELAKLGFTPAPDANSAKLKVGVFVSVIDRPTRVLEATDPFWMGPPYFGRGYFAGRYYRPFWGPRWGYGPFYDPWMYGPLEVRETIRHNYERQLRVAINDTAGQKLYDVTVQNTSRRKSTPEIMPALVQSAFTGFPAQNGQVRQVELKVE
jgi:hypothetical protein